MSGKLIFFPQIMRNVLSALIIIHLLIFLSPANTQQQQNNENVDLSESALQIKMDKQKYSQYEKTENKLPRFYSQIVLNCTSQQTIVQLTSAQQTINASLAGIKDLVPTNIYEQVENILSQWNKTKLIKFTKKVVQINSTGSSTAIFVGVFIKRTQDKFYIASKLCRNSTQTVPEIEIFHRASASEALLYWEANTAADSFFKLADQQTSVEILRKIFTHHPIMVIDLDWLQQILQL